VKLLRGIEGEKSKHSNRLIILILIILSSLILAGCYNILNRFVLQARTSDRTPELLPLQIVSPQENSTYQAVNIPLNITANNATAKITYSLDGAENVTLNKNVATTPSLTKGGHNLTVYAFDSEGKVSDCKYIIFNVYIPYPPTLKLTQQELQSTISYFKSQGLTIQVFDADANEPQFWLNTGVVDLGSKEELATFATSRGITIIKEFIDPTHVSFCAYVYDHSPLPTIYSFSATIS
jgi:hypothetical protein